MIGYMKAEEAAKRWDVSPRQVQRMCVEGRIKDAEKFGNTWAIPENAPKPTRTGKLKPGRKPGTHGRAVSEANSQPKTREGK